MEKEVIISSSAPSLQNIDIHITSARSDSCADSARIPSAKPETIAKVNDERNTEYPGGMKLALIVAAACFSVFLMALDNCIIATAIPRITDEFDSLKDVAGIFSGALIVLAHSIPLKKRPIYTGIVSSMWGISSVAGPLLGGFFTDNLTWRWCFYINLPIGAATVFVIILFFPDPIRSISQETWRTRLVQTDPLGNILFMPSVVCLLLALHWGGVMYPWSSTRIIALFVAFAIGMLGFIYLQYLGQENATVPPRIIKKRTVWSCSFFSFALGAAFLLSVYYLPIWFQSVQGVSAVNSGVRNLPMLVGNLVFSLVAGAAVTVWGYYTPFMLLSSVLMSIGYGLLSTISPESPCAMWFGYQIIAGAGVGVGMQQPLIAVQVVLDMPDVPTGTAIVIFAQQIGGAIFVAIGQAVFTNGLIERLLQHIPSINSHSVIATGVTAIRKTIDLGLLPTVAHAYSDSLVQTLLISAVAASSTIIGAVFVEWESVKGKAVQPSMV
ncbi:aspyridones efflux protein [Colletotrichum spaethianum]|uniref:Aspyridones efflux protein n=1 Tax=Colletotrichum spaethianum TaxID=700344 RepID=A0AA37NTA0_9PEZI|nr:aspyridones efflux protein [Colletotrichum spaethianum]GKT40627.1 aspyridones efflux protein [Colletotrichum spaethianum]